MKYGPANSNWKGGTHSFWDGDKTIQIALAKDKLRKIMDTPCDSSGRSVFPAEDVQWAMRVVKERPEWAIQTLKELGFP